MSFPGSSSAPLMLRPPIESCMSKASLEPLPLPVDTTERQAALDMRVLAWRSGAAANALRVADRIAAGELASPRSVRFELIRKCHQFLVDKRANGDASATVRSHYLALRTFYGYVDTLGGDIDEANVRDWFSRWIDHLLKRCALGQMADQTAYHQGKSTALVLAGAMEVNFISIVRGSRLRKPKNDKAFLGRAADKQNLKFTQSFGADLLDIIQSLTLDACFGPLPVPLVLRSTPAPHAFWCGIPPSDTIKAVTNPSPTHVGSVNNILRRREERSLRPTVINRHRVVNLRITAEFLVFIAQTGMNRAQAMRLTLGDFRYESWQDGYRVRKYKGRKKGEVLFEIFSGYRPHFERYLAFRENVCPKETSDVLFPTIKRGNPSKGAVFNIENVRRFLASVDRPFLSPQRLRNTRVNWLLRATDDAALTASMAQHDVQTLHRSYAKPNHQRAVVEWGRFFQQVESALVNAPAPGVCASSEPQKDPQFVEATPTPDCRNPAGCLFCLFYRGIESPDYAWSMASLRYLKRQELALYRPHPKASEEDSGPMAVIARVTDILAQLAAKGSAQHAWVEEAYTRMEEAHYHPRWAGFILMAEALQ